MSDVIALDPPAPNYHSDNEIWLDEQIWGHRLWDGQDPWMLFLEFLSIAEACHTDGRLLQPEQPLFPFRYRPAQRPYLRNLLYNNDKLTEIAEQYPDDNTAWREWLARMQEKAQGVHDRDFSYLRKRFRTLHQLATMIGRYRRDRSPW